MKSHRGADAFAAQDVAKLMQRLAEYTLGLVLEWEENERARPDQKVDAFAYFLRAHASHSVRLRGTTVTVGWGCYRNGNNQSQSIQCWIVRAKR
jgi:hypothetical protein